jgi:hypothetical protein
MVWQTRQRHFSDFPVQLTRRCWIIDSLLFWSLIVALHTGAGEGGQMPNQGGQPQDPCQFLIRQSADHLRQILDFRLLRGFPVTAQLAEGNARLAPLSIVMIDCEQQRVEVSGGYEFRSNFGVIDITRRGTAVLQFRMRSKPGQHQVWLEDPEVLDVTFDNPAPWFDGKAISNWARTLFVEPVCANVQNGQPC